MNNASAGVSSDFLHGITILVAARLAADGPVQEDAPTVPARMAPTQQLSMPLEVAKDRHPWDDAHPRIKEQFTMRLPQALHAKLKYIAEHSPESMHDIALAAVSAAVEKRLREMDIKG